MSKNPLNLMVRLLLEISSLIVMGIWGWHQATGIMRFVFAISIPVTAATLWGTFRVPNDPGKAPVPIPGLIRLLYEVIYFGFAIWALFDIQSTNIGWIMLGIVLIHYLISYDRILWMLRR